MQRVSSEAGIWWIRYCFVRNVTCRTWAEPFFDEGLLVGRIGVKNLTNGKGSIVGELSAEDWVRVMRHGLNEEGRTLIDMPSQTYNFLSDKDLGSVIAYVRSVSPVDRRSRKLKWDL